MICYPVIHVALGVTRNSFLLIAELSTKTTTSQANMVSSSKVYADLVALLVPQLLGYSRFRPL